jgi:hypothetical protein
LEPLQIERGRRSLHPLEITKATVLRDLGVFNVLGSPTEAAAAKRHDLSRAEPSGASCPLNGGRLRNQVTLAVRSLEDEERVITRLIEARSGDPTSHLGSRMDTGQDDRSVAIRDPGARASQALLDVASQLKLPKCGLEVCREPPGPATKALGKAQAFQEGDAAEVLQPPLLRTWVCRDRVFEGDPAVG